MNCKLDNEGLVRCECGTPLFQIVGNVLLFQNRHHGQQHVTALSMAALLQMVTEGDKVKVS